MERSESDKVGEPCPSAPCPAPGRDPTHNIHMGECAERCADEFGISRAEQDDHALESHRRAGEAARAGLTAEVCAGGAPGGMPCRP
jgi:acetyl-CoA acetyltransferase